MQLIEHTDQCPYCGEPLLLLLDNSVDAQNYIEDCQVCCRPINVYLEFIDEDHFHIRLYTENDV